LDEYSAGVEEGYERYFGLAEPPFRLTSSPRFLFESTSFLSAFKEVDRALTRREPIIVVTGEMGTGKTTLCRMIGERRGPRAVVAVISSPPHSVDDLFRQILDGFGLLTDDTRRIVEASHFGMLKVFQQFLDSLVRLPAQAILVFDEAQHIRPDMLEEVRLLSNLDSDHQTLQIVLVGQPELNPLLARDDLGQLAQRVSRWHRLQPLQIAEVPAYVDRRLSAAQLDEAAGGRPTFTDAAMQSIATLSHGVPRVVNLICDRSLENAWSDHTHSIDTDAVARAAKALNIDAASESAAVSPMSPVSRVSPPESTLPAFEPTPQAGSELAAFNWEADLRPDTKLQKFHVERTTKLPLETTRQPDEEHATTTEPDWATAPETDVPMKRVRFKRSHAQIAVGAVVLLSALLFWFFRAQPVSQETPPPAEKNPGRPMAAAAPSPAQPAAPKTSPSATPTAAPAAATGGDKFSIVVSSFRTRDRATEVSADVAALGLPASVRSASGWEQVVVGPYSLRSEAVAAQNRLVDAHFTDTKLTQATLVPSGGPATPASQPPPPAADLSSLSLDDLLRRATALTAQGNVKSLQQIHDQILKRQAASAPGSADFTAALNQLERNLDETRRRQLEEDRRQLIGKP